jgi:hypothetical protein
VMRTLLLSNELLLVLHLEHHVRAAAHVHSLQGTYARRAES